MEGQVESEKDMRGLGDKLVKSVKIKVASENGGEKIRTTGGWSHKETMAMVQYIADPEKWKDFKLKQAYHFKKVS